MSTKTVVSALCTAALQLTFIAHVSHSTAFLYSWPLCVFHHNSEFGI